MIESALRFFNIKVQSLNFRPIAMVPFRLRAQMQFLWLLQSVDVLYMCSQHDFKISDSVFNIIAGLSGVILWLFFFFIWNNIYGFKTSSLTNESQRHFDTNSQNVSKTYAAYDTLTWIWLSDRNSLEAEINYFSVLVGFKLYSYGF